jgi:hypothetical protein
MIGFCDSKATNKLVLYSVGLSMDEETTMY